MPVECGFRRVSQNGNFLPLLVPDRAHLHHLRGFFQDIALKIDAGSSVPEDEGMMEANPVLSDCEGGRLRAQGAVAELYQLAALLVGDETRAAELVESVVARTEIDPCADADASVESARVHLVEAAVASFRRVDPRAFDAPAAPDTIGGCIESDDLSTSHLAGMAAGPGRGALRAWLEKLSAVQRVIFVQRAILGWDHPFSAALLERAGCGGWKARQLGEVFRQALCSLATSLAHAATAGA